MVQAPVPLDPTPMDPRPPRLTFGRYIRHLRESRGWTQPQLVKASGLGGGTISKIENDETNRTQRTTEKLAAAFNMSVAALESSYQRFAATEAEPQPLQPLLRRITDRGLDPVIVKLAERIQNLSGPARHAIEGVLMAFEETEKGKSRKE